MYTRVSGHKHNYFKLCEKQLQGSGTSQIIVFFCESKRLGKGWSWGNGTSHHRKKEKKLSLKRFGVHVFIYHRNGHIVMISYTRSDKKAFDCEFCSIMSVLDPH